MPPPSTSTRPGATPGTPPSSSPRPPSGFSRKYAPACAASRPAISLIGASSGSRRSSVSTVSYATAVMPLSTSARVSGSSAAMWRYVKSTSPSRRRGYSAAIGSFTLSSSSGLRPDVVDGDDARAGALVVGVGERAAVAGRRLDEHLVALLHELARARRRQRDAVLVGLDLLGDADAHDARDDSASGYQRCQD